MRRVAIATVVLAVLLACSAKQSPQPAPVAPAPAVTTSSPAAASPSPSPSPSLVAMPNLVGLNAAVAQDQLKHLGFTNVQLGTVDGHAFVALPENWTVKSQSAKAGTKIMSDMLIVLGCAKNS